MRSVERRASPRGVTPVDARRADVARAAFVADLHDAAVVDQHRDRAAAADSCDHPPQRAGVALDVVLDEVATAQLEVVAELRGVRARRRPVQLKHRRRRASAARMHVVDGALRLLDARHVVGAHDDRDVGEAAPHDLAAVVSEQRDAQQPALARFLERGDDVLRAAARRERERDVVRPRLRDELAQERELGADVVRDRGEHRGLGRERDRRERRHARRAEHAVQREVGRVGRRAAVAEEQQPPAGARALARSRAPPRDRRASSSATRARSRSASSRLRDDRRGDVVDERRGARGCSPRNG